MSYTIRDIQKEMESCERYLEIEKLPPGLHRKLQVEKEAKKREADARKEASLDGLREQFRRSETPMDTLSFSLWNSTVAGQDPTSMRRNTHEQMSVQREDQEAVWDPEALDRDPFVTGGWQPQGRPTSGYGGRPRSGFGNRPALKPGGGRATTPGIAGPGQRGQPGTLLWRVSGQSNNLRKNQDSEYWDHYSRYTGMKKAVEEYNRQHGRKV